MKFKNIFQLFLAGTFLAGASSCVDEIEYTPAEKVDLAEFYFSTGNANEQTIEEGQTSFSVLLGRLNAGAEQTVNITSTVTADVEGTTGAPFTIPATATFAEGEGTASVEITIDESLLQRKVNYTLSLSLEGVQNTPYYLGTLDVVCNYNPWITLGTGIYVEALAGSIFDLTAQGWPFNYAVTVQEHPDTKGFYRILNPYTTDAFPLGSQASTDKDYYIYVHAEDAAQCYVESSNTGCNLNPSYGNILVTSYAWEAMLEGASNDDVAAEGLFGTMENGNIVMPAGTLQLAMELYNNGAWSFDSAADFVLVLPGYKLVTDWDVLGTCQFTDGFAGPFFSTAVNGNTYNVVVERHKKNPNIIRISEPFGDASGYKKPNFATSEYITFDVSDPDCVVLTESIVTPVSNLRRGVFHATTEANYYMEVEGLTKDEVKEAGLGGTFKNDVITIPGAQICGTWSLVEDGELVYQPTNTDVVLNITPIQEAPAANVKSVAPREFKLRK